ncbi:MAG: hypothetical protein A3C44_00885 [Gammaproteobacteria bacterium RIFCSPHIGHO2_02_FULL_39_13]|nr:MAG: hypothetical protein A3C44_00885 [Gammaproteobacteria bacterium RIFCSPHIGHO2_02_FULL_39_13]OGT48491.1 MAG: hypothetical protein A3E53_03815 [Gammaproteobacteria bacterium RIFCSPHIGHO2_12_FULL_39_24]
MRKVALYFHTLKYLKFKQIYYRLFYLLYKKTPSKKINNISLRDYSLAKENYFILKNKIYFENTTATFLNKSVDISQKNSWNDLSQTDLWLYNLHYFDALHSFDANQRQIAYKLLERWVDENPPYFGIGWKPFSASLRIINIIKYALSGNLLSEKVICSLYLQARYLDKKCEYHLLGNHLFENFKSLCVAGLFFDTKESRGWFSKGLRGLKKEIQEQVLWDGGHFELSPMYHCLFLEGLLDLHVIFKLYQKEFFWKSDVEKMLAWLNEMKRSDHKIAYFNDAANHIAASPGELFSYAKKLGYEIPPEKNGLSYFSNSGYITVKNNYFKIIMDVGNIGPDYLPGHGHADALSFECYVDGIPLFVNLGTSCYENNDRRLFERGTRAHNTVEINQQDSSHVWSSFRVGKRARVKNINIVDDKNKFLIQASHDGYARLKRNLHHKRIWEISENKIEIKDYLNNPVEQAYAYFHLHPDVNIVSRLSDSVIMQLKNNKKISFETKNDFFVIDSQYAELFGKLHNTQSIKIRINSNDNQFSILMK